jgi:hypothetical protein
MRPELYSTYVPINIAEPRCFEPPFFVVGRVRALVLGDLMTLDAIRIYTRIGNDPTPSMEYTDTVSVGAKVQ